MPTVSYQVRIDWDASNSFTAGALAATYGSTNATATAPAERVRMLDAQAAVLATGDKVQLCNSSGALKEDRVVTVAGKDSAGGGNTWVYVNPPLVTAVASGDRLRKVTLDQTDVTYARKSGLTIGYGRDQARQLSSLAAGLASFALDNGSRVYTPENTSSPLTGQIKPNRPVYIFAIFNGTVYPMYRGHTDDYEATVQGKGRGQVDITCVDGIGDIHGVNVSTPVYTGIRTGDAIGYVLDAIGWPDAARDIDPGATIIPVWWADGTDAGSMLEQLVNSEGPGSLITIDGSGNFVFRDRHHRYTRSASTSVQATFRDAGADPRFSRPTTYDHGWKDIINSVDVDVDVRTGSTALEQVWSSEMTYSLAANEVVTIVASASDPLTDIQTPSTAAGDYVLQSGSVTVSLTVISAQTVSIRLTAGGSGALVTDLRLRATPYKVTRSAHYTRDNAPSQSTYGKRSYTLDAPWAGEYDAIAIADLILAIRAERQPVMEITLTGGNDTILAQQFSRDLSDRVTIIDSEFGVNAPFYIEHIAHSLRGKGSLSQIHETTFMCEKVNYTPGNLFIFDTSGHGFNQGVFAP